MWQQEGRFSASMGMNFLPLQITSKIDTNAFILMEHPVLHCIFGFPVEFQGPQYHYSHFHLYDN